MKTALKFVGILSLAGTIVPPVLFLFGSLGENVMKAVMLVSTVLWFATAPFWMKGGE